MEEVGKDRAQYHPNTFYTHLPHLLQKLFSELLINVIHSSNSFLASAPDSLLER